MTKPFWHSKTLWLNTLAAAATAVLPAIPAAWGVPLLALLNAVVRTRTRSSITWQK